MPGLTKETIRELGIDTIIKAVEDFNQEQTNIFNHVVQSQEILRDKETQALFKSYKPKNLTEELFTKTQIEEYYTKLRNEENILKEKMHEWFKNTIPENDIKIISKASNNLHQKVLENSNDIRYVCKLGVQNDDAVYRFFHIDNLLKETLFQEVIYFPYGIALCINYDAMENSFFLDENGKLRCIDIVEKVAANSYHCVLNDNVSLLIKYTKECLVIEYSKDKKLTTRRIEIFVFDESENYSKILQRIYQKKPDDVSVLIDSEIFEEQVYLNYWVHSNNIATFVRVQYDKDPNSVHEVFGFSIIGGITKPGIFSKNSINEQFGSQD